MPTPDFLDGITFDDVLLVPAKSDILPAEADTTTSFSRNIKLNTPIASAAMDTVTEAHSEGRESQPCGIIWHGGISDERQDRH